MAHYQEKLSSISSHSDDPLFSRARHVILSAQAPHSRSWFSRIPNISIPYHIILTFSLTYSPFKFKKLTEAKVTDYWETKLRKEAAILPSLNYFKPDFYSLRHPNPILWTPGANQHTVSKSLIPLKMLRQRYRLARLTQHWNPNNKSGCWPALETLEYLLVS